MQQSYDFDSNVIIQLYHALDAGSIDEFTSRGNITIHSINSGEVNIHQKALNQEAQKKIFELAKKNKFYRVRADVVGSDGVKTSFLTSSKACLLLQSQFNDELTISFDHNPIVVGVNHKPLNLEAVPDTCESFDERLIDEIDEFSTVVTIRTIEPAPVPDTQGFIQKLEKEREARERGQTPDNRSFLAKYWMYIVS